MAHSGRRRRCHTHGYSVNPWVNAACEGSLTDLRCPPHRLVWITAAQYGRASMMTCGGERRLCRGHSVLSRLAVKCDGKQKCAVIVDSLWLGDSCFGVSKHLTTAYQCVGQDQLLQLER